MKRFLGLRFAITSIVLATATVAPPLAFGGGVGATIGGGVGNSANGDYSTVSGGYANAGDGTYSVVGGGNGNVAENLYSTIGGGAANHASLYATTSGGNWNYAKGFYSFVGGGNSNVADGNDTTVAGGESNIASGVYSVVGGGYNNTASADNSTIAGGYNNYAGEMASIGGGYSNSAWGERSTIAGGSTNEAQGVGAFVAGGQNNTAGGDYSFAGGRNALVRTPGLAGGKAGGDEGSFVWNDGQLNLSTWASKQFIVGANGGFGVNTAPINANVAMTIAATAVNPNYSSIFLRGANTQEGILISSGDVNPNLGASFYVDQYNGSGHARRFSIDPGGKLTITNQAYKPGGGSWAASSDGRLKKNVQPLGHALDRMLKLKGVTFEYSHPDGAMHPEGTFSGFIAQDVEKVFPNWIGHDNDGYLTVGPQGFEAITVEALRELKTSQDERVAKLEHDNADLRDLVANQTKAISDLRHEIAAITSTVDLKARQIADAGGAR